MLLVLYLCFFLINFTALCSGKVSVLSDIVEPGSPAKDCDSDVCKLPSCRCSGNDIPGGLAPKDTPQIVVVAFDDAVNAINMNYYLDLFNNGDKARKNPNGCNSTATFFVNHEWTNYWMVNQLYHYRHEIADLSVTKRLPIAWWKTATYDEWKNEADGQRKILAKFANIKSTDVRGFRAPYLESGGENQFRAVHDLSFTYDSSMPTPNAYLWPYTLDYRSTQVCVIPPCPEESYPGLWEFPLTDYIASDGSLCNEVDACTVPANESEAYALLKINFNRHYGSNRSPFPIFLRARWFQKWPYTLTAMGDFLDYLGTLKDVYLVTLSQAIQWIQNPTAVSKIGDFKPWQCKTDAPAVCSDEDSVVCPYDQKGNLVPSGSAAYHYMHICNLPCPLQYPWLSG